MDLITREELNTLLTQAQEPSVSIFMSTERMGAETSQNPIRFKNLLKEAEEKLMAFGLRTPDVLKLLEPAQKLLQESPGWWRRSDGIAAFLTPQEAFFYRLPAKFEALSAVSRRFHIKPLLPLLSGDGIFYVLALSQNQVKLYQATRYSISEVDVEGIPEGLKDALKFDDFEKQLQLHSPKERRGERKGAIFHGHGGPTADFDEKNLFRYFKQVDQGLQEVLKGEKALMILAGVDYLFPIYREASANPHLLEKGIPGNPDIVTAEELHQRAWEIVEPYFLKSQQDTVGKYKELAGTGLASNNMEEILAASFHGRVEALFVARDLQCWGHYDAENGIVKLHQDAGPGDEDILDLATAQTLMNGGVVFAVKREEMPDETLLAAIFRY